MLYEEDFFEPLIERMRTTPDFEKSHIFQGHQKNILAISDMPEYMESDIFACDKNSIVHAFHVKTNLDTSEGFKLLGKLHLSSLAVPNTWVILERKIKKMHNYVKNLPKGVGVIFFSGRKEGNIPTVESFEIKRNPKYIKNPRYANLTQKNFRKLKGRGELDQIGYYILTGIETKKSPNWSIGKNNRVWGVEKEREFNKIKSAPAGSFIFFMISDYTKRKSRGELVGLYSLITPFKDVKEKRDKFRRIWPDKDYSYRCDMMPVITEEFKKGIPKKFINRILGYKPKHVMWPSITPLTQKQFEKILIDLLKRNNKSLIKEIYKMRNKS